MTDIKDIKQIEYDLLNNPSELSSMNNLLKIYQFSEDFLIKTRIYYDSWKCLKFQNNLSLYFCVHYLYNTPEYDSADDWTDYNQIVDYLTKRNYTILEIDEEINKLD
jgi:hypothetical protein